MEQKKVLWIAVALGIFLLVIFAGTLIMYSPNKQNNNTNGTMVAGNDLWVNPDIPVATDSSYKELPDLPNDNGTFVVEEDTPQNNIIDTKEVIINAEKTTVVSPKAEVTIDVQEIANEKNEDRIINSVTPITTKRPTSTVTSANTIPAVTPETKKTETVTKTPAKPQPPKDQYWVQAASFTSKQNAEIAQQTLLKQKIPAEVFTYTNNKNVIFYRVRVGPYTTKSEAEYWHKLIKTVDNFKNTESYVTNSSLAAQ